MRAIVMDGFGGPEVLSLGEAPEPELRPGDLLVRVRAAGLNRSDVFQRRGAYGHDYFGDSEIMGLEIAGEVVGMAGDVEGFAIGDRVMGLVGGGAYAETARIPAAMAMRIPDNLDFTQAAAVPEAFIVAHECLLELGRLAAGETVLLHGAAGGVGIAAVALARRIGARVLFTARPASFSAVHADGGDKGIDYKEDFLPFVLDETDGEGVDLIIDPIGAPTLERNVLALRTGGRLIQLGLMGGKGPAPVPLDRLLFRRLSIIGTVLKTRPVALKAALTQRFADRWMPEIATGALQPRISVTFPLAQAADAHRAMEAGGHVGKLILIP
ncbi:MAG: quinone oxidoreductase [Caulobacteraceae bacterium]|nr:quinone oxidoreductase [Caulobacteraceae bacterium]